MKKYQDIKIAVDVAVFTIKDRKLHVLLIQMKKKPFFKWWAFPGGLVNKNERLEAAARRMLQMKTGVKNIYLEQLYTFDALDRDPLGRVISCAYFALIPETIRELQTTDKYLDVKFWPVDLLPPLAYDHDMVMRYALKRLRAKLEYSNMVWSLLPKEFTLTELQIVYEIILGRKLDKRNFRKRISQLKIIVSTRKKKKRGAFRPALLYRFTTTRPMIVEII